MVLKVLTCSLGCSSCETPAFALILGWFGALDSIKSQLQPLGQVLLRDPTRLKQLAPDKSHELYIIYNYIVDIVDIQVLFCTLLERTHAEVGAFWPQFTRK